MKFVCIGNGAEEQALKALSIELGIADRVLFPGAAHNTVAALNGLDLFCSASISEGFSNSIAEAMACGLRCVVTDAGNSALIVGDCGRVVPRSSPDAFADGILQQLKTLDDGEFSWGASESPRNSRSRRWWTGLVRCFSRSPELIERGIDCRARGRSDC